ncbi:uncharacterized protein N7477_004031 [Penicillium maclennaniae]|uniref:uncharacterized protein n=1 Tax=Penicillium maclennaniae TaxID=1343394 RepID=UPI00253F9D80|nr:uncharacterized protein N7477_004031 [Penicillium maclennaniae]KAJ5678398.1 hypothetical protein N7477_004031 [Penicillium maclennaniae]
MLRFFATHDRRFASVLACVRFANEKFGGIFNYPTRSPLLSRSAEPVLPVRAWCDIHNCTWHQKHRGTRLADTPWESRCGDCV